MNRWCKNIQLKRWFLPTLCVLGIVAFEDVRNYMYLPIIFTYAGFVFFWNFPSLAYFSNSKPLYYEDLFIDTRKLPNYEVSRNIKKKFNKILQWVLIVTTSLCVGALSDFWLYKANNVTSIVEFIGITGGILKIFQIVNNTLSGGLIYIIRHYVIVESKKKRLGIELTTRERLQSCDTIDPIPDYRNIILSPNKKIRVFPTNDMIVGISGDCRNVITSHNEDDCDISNNSKYM
jgi:hypothetical protein